MRIHTLLTIAVTLMTSSMAFAQGGVYSHPTTTSYKKPTVSPYLGLTRGGNPAVNYYNIVRPQQQFGASINRLQQQVAVNADNITQVRDGDQLPDTGHPIQFLNYGRYFQNLNAARASGQANRLSISDLTVSTSLRQSIRRSVIAPEYPVRRDQ